MELENKYNKLYSFLINTSNQANLSNTNNKDITQINSVFVLIHPYYIDKLNIENLDLDIQVTEEGIVKINNEEFKVKEIEKGVSVFGLIKREEDVSNEV
ncbi:hypothetical protein CLPU_10c01220 [Gottschalkia purinilytica]|uniref:Uncharacterized protein n=1 Tax=Gottschalkia purinilytica TaxID=1503 RepID=A0A0L0W9F3_GOTPU|nr:hypothetical protein [Gottschalkia purinilytica]KNF08067.1 hypothetical protein CLPU_10c01220 [Gottschalkia purinilytica]